MELVNSNPMIANQPNDSTAACCAPCMFDLRIPAVVAIVAAAFSLAFDINITFALIFEDFGSAVWSKYWNDP